MENRPIIGLLEDVVRRHPHRLAVTDGGKSLSYKELWDGLSGLAESIAADTKPGELIGIHLPMGPMFPLVMLACLAAGRPFVPLDPQYPDDWLRQVLADAQPAKIIGPQDLSGLPRAARTGWRPTGLGVDEPACVLFTSGSTGRPKGIVNSQRNLLRRVAQSIDAAHITADDRFLTLASLCTIVGVRDTLTALLAGASVRLLDPQRAGAREIVNVVRADAVTILFAFPALLRSVVPQDGERAPETLRLVRVGGDTTLWSDVDLLRGWLQPQAAIQVIYAATEAPMMQWFVDDSCRTDDPRLPIGRPGNDLAVIDDELVVESPYVALGHWRDGRCVPGSIESNGSSRVFRTGDLVRLRPDGLLERIGRKDRQVKIRGARVDLDGVEAAIRRHPAVRDVGALARGEALVAYVSAGGEAAGLLDDLKETMRTVPPSMRPARVYLVPEIPRLPSSKLDVRALMALDDVNVRNERAAIVASAAGNGIARTVADVWQRVLQTPVVGPHDDFFDAGGDSLKAITLVLELERALGLDLSPALIAEAPTFGSLCEALSAGTTRDNPFVLMKEGDGGPPLFMIPGLGGSVAGLVPMTRRMTYPGAVIGIQARGLDGREAPHATVEAMAAAYVREVKGRQPDGPYYLCGYSFGGLVAFEMARRLRQSGDEVALLGLLDTMMSPLRWPARSWLSMIRIWPSAVWGKGSRAWSLNVLRVTASALLASARYRPGFYPGHLTLFAPQDRDPGLPSLHAIWRTHARTLSVVETAGAHATMFSATHAESTAASLTRCLPLTVG